MYSSLWWGRHGVANGGFQLSLRRSCNRETRASAGLQDNHQGLPSGDPPLPANPYLLMIIQPLNSVPHTGVPVGDISHPTVIVFTALHVTIAHSVL